MFTKLLAKLLKVSPEVIIFIGDNRKRYFQRLLLLLPLTIWSSLFYQLNPLIIKFQIDILTEKFTNIGWFNFKNALNLFIFISVIYLLLSLFDKLLNYFKNSLLQKLNQQTESFLEDKFNNFLTKFDSSFLSGENNLRLIRNLQWQFGSIESKINDLYQKIIEISIGSIAVLGIIPLIHPYLLSLILITVTITIALEGIQNNSWRKFEIIENRQTELRREIQWRLIWYFNRILLNGWVKEIYNNYKNRRLESFNVQYKQQNLDRKYSLLISGANKFGEFFSTLLAGLFVLTGAIELSTFVIFGMYTDRIRGLIDNLGSVFRLITELRFELFRIDFLIHLEPKLDYSRILPYQNKVINSIEFKNVSFKYPKFFEQEEQYLLEMRSRVGLLENTDQAKNSKLSIKKIFKKLTAGNISNWGIRQLNEEFKELDDLFKKSGKNKIILENLNFSLSKGKIYAFVGYNGAGKTTLTKLIKRGIDTSSGQILINNRNLTTIDPLLWKENFANIEQESFVWDSLSVRQNLLLGINPNYQINDTKIWEALEKVGLKEIITDLDFIFGEGIELSGGQKQLLELARVYLQQKPIVILDEGTNQLDAVKESQVINILQEIKQNSIIILITHRMTTCQKCDKIFVLEHGKIQASGTHKDLIKDSNNLYSKFWKIQVFDNN